MMTMNDYCKQQELRDRVRATRASGAQEMRLAASCELSELLAASWFSELMSELKAEGCRFSAVRAKHVIIIRW